MKIKHLIVDFHDLLLDSENIKDSVKYYYKNKTFLISKDRLKMVIGYMSKNPEMILIVAQNGGTILQEIDFKDILSDLGVPRDNIRMVDKSQYYGNNNIQKVLQVYNYIRLHTNKNEVVKVLIVEDKDYTDRMKYINSFHSDIIHTLIDVIELKTIMN